ncbi:hypothetical protein MMC07_001015 [Pseudocyphellaria aurata]|nr:hypothetical protein [Pseudocyphellaria aurata]
MARPFDERAPLQYTGSSLSSQTSLSGTRARTSYPPYRLSDDSRQASNAPRGVITSSKMQPGSRLAKIRSSSSHGTLASARKASSHGGLHSHEVSATSNQSPTSSTLDTQYPSSVNIQTLTSSTNAHFDPYALPSPSSISKTKVMIKPFLRKLSSQEQTSIDLSRSAAENEGLGIYNSSEISSGPAYTEIGYGSISPSARGYHHRTTSGNSQISTNTSSSNHRYGTQYIHPMRQTPRPYTPTLAASYQNSLDSEMSAPAPIRASSEGSHLESTHDAPMPYAQLPPTRRVPPPLHLGSSSFLHLTSCSQTNLPGTPSSLRLQTDNIDNLDMMAPTARSSLESSFRKRSRANTQTDPATQAATVQALRQKFNEKEAAKDLKFQQAEARAKEKEVKKKEKREEEDRRKSEGKERRRAKSNTASEKSGTGITDEHEQRTPMAPFVEEEVFPRSSQQRRRPVEKAGVAGKAVQSQWQLFWFKFKTMWLKLKKKMSGSATKG